MIKRIEAKCKRCGKEWRPLIYPPRICVHCKSKYWNEDKRKLKDKKKLKPRSISESTTNGKYILAFGDTSHIVCDPKALFHYKVLLTEENITQLLDVKQPQVNRMMRSLIAEGFITVYTPRVKKIFNKKDKNGKKEYSITGFIFSRKYALDYNNIVIKFFEKIKLIVLELLNKKKDFLSGEIAKTKDKFFMEMGKKSVEELKEEYKQVEDFSINNINKDLKQILRQELKTCVFNLYFEFEAGIDFSINDIMNTYFFNVLKVLELYPKVTPNVVSKIIREYQKSLILTYY